jgi:hypothetical protein
MVEQHRIDNRGWQVNWGKSFPVNSGNVEYVNLRLSKPQDITLYLGNPSEQNNFVAGNYVVSVGSGGTTFDYLVGTNIYGLATGIASSVRGTVLHFIADHLYVRGDTASLLTPFLPADTLALIRFGGQAGLGRPTAYERFHPEERQANGDSEVDFTLTPWSTHVRVMVAFDPATDNAIDGFQVRQTSTVPGLGTTDVVGNMPIALYQQPGGFPLHGSANGIIVTTTGGGGPPPAGPSGGAVYKLYIAETLMY